MHRSAPWDGCLEPCTAAVVPSDNTSSAPERLSVIVPASAKIAFNHQLKLTPFSRPWTPNSRSLVACQARIKTCQHLNR
jgi:hypothetical protein